ncbi:Prefoldin subunit-domain-containing protein [Pyronema omphalodes]|nr:Prefoldin subunit-domain-containing protein [Pyronema omphalodes]
MSLPIPATLEAHRIRLEETLSKLRVTLDNWRVYSFEYEAFREELQALGKNATQKEMLAVGLEIDGKLVDEREIRNMLGEKQNIKRTRDQVITTVSHRLDYVDENVKKVQKQVDENEEKLAQLQILISPEAKNEEGMAVMDIHEELDDEDNVLNAWVNGKDPDAESRTLDPKELLKLENWAQKIDSEKEAAEKGQKTEEVKETAKEPESKPVESAPKAPAPAPASAPASAPKPTESAPKAPETKNTTPTPGVEQIAVVDVPDEEDKEEEGGGYVKILDDPDEPSPENWVTQVAGETDEETALRRQMLNYNMEEIGAVVAELNLEEDGDFYGYEGYSDEDFDFDEDEDDDDDDEDEDKYGRTTRRVVSESYRRQMEELEERLTGKIPAAKKAADAKAKAAEANNKISEESAAKSAEEKSGKKGVRFAEELDIAPHTSLPPLPAKPVAAPAQPTTTAAEKPASVINQEIDIAPDENDAIPFIAELLERQEAANGPTPVAPQPILSASKPKPTVSRFKREKASGPSPLSQVSSVSESAVPAPVVEEVKEVSAAVVAESVMERAPGAVSVPVMPPSLPQKKLSRFAAAKQAAAEAAAKSEPNTPKGVMANEVVEREPAGVKAKPPSDMDPDTHRQEVAMQYHKLRNKMIHQQGGYMETEEEQAIVPLEEGPKISRFKAARLRGLGPQ